MYTTKQSDRFAVFFSLNTTLCHAEDMILNIYSNKIKYLFRFLSQYTVFFQVKNTLPPFYRKTDKINLIIKKKYIFFYNVAAIISMAVCVKIMVSAKGDLAQKEKKMPTAWYV